MIKEKASIHRERRIWWHWQNLKKEDGSRGWVNGRGWLHIGNAVFGCQWVIPSNNFGISFSIGEGEYQLLGSMGCGLFAFYWHLEGVRWLYKYLGDTREISLRFFGGAMWWHIWQDPDEWRSDDPKWRRGTFRPIDFILGRDKYSFQDKASEERTIAFPEGTYAAKIRLFTSTWKRPRWHWARTIERAEVDVKGGVPIPGKGENSWDLDDDAIYSLTTPATSVDEAIEKFVKTVNNRRLKYGGENWIPEKESKP